MPPTLIFAPFSAIGFAIASMSIPVFLALTIRRVEKETRDLGAPRVTRTLPRGKRTSTAQPLRPILRAGVSGLGLGEQRRVLRLVAVALFAIIAWIPLYGAGLILFLMYWDIVSALQRFTQSGGLDDVRIVNVTDRELGRAAYVTACIGAWPYLAGLTIGNTISVFSLGFGDENLLNATLLVLAEFAFALCYFAALAAQATYWGVAHGRRRHNGLYYYFGILFAASILNQFVLEFIYNVTNIIVTNFVSWGIYKLTTTTLPSLFLIGLALTTYFELGRQWRSDLSPKKLRSQPQRQRPIAE
jgi:hypothetical protein